MRRRGQILVLLSALLGGAAPAVSAPRQGPSASAAASPAEGGRARPRKGLMGVVNLNQADEAALELLPGIGPTKSARIIEHRRTHPFRRIEELTRVKGIGRKTFARLKGHLAVSGPTTLSEISDGKDDPAPRHPGADGMK